MHCNVLIFVEDGYCIIIPCVIKIEFNDKLQNRICYALTTPVLITSQKINIFHSFFYSITKLFILHLDRHCMFLSKNTFLKVARNI